MKCKVILNELVLAIVAIIFAIAPCECQREPRLPITGNSFSQILRTQIRVPAGRSANSRDVIMRFYGANSTEPSASLRLRAVKCLLRESNFDLNKPTVIHAHGYVELITDESMRLAIKAYLQNGQYNIVMLDYSNLAFGDYITASLNVPSVGKETARAVARLVKGGLPAANLHFVGHSLGAHVVGAAARYLAGKGIRIPRVTGLDPAYPGFYPALLGQPLSPADAEFVDVIHTAGGGYGTPARTGHADFWPNEGYATQPGCPSATVPFSNEDFCSHWRSWRYWAESVTGGEFLARRCDSYDSFLRRNCSASPAVYMGLRATADLRGDFYLRTATKKPYALGITGAD